MVNESKDDTVRETRDESGRSRMPGKLKLVIAVLVFQAVGNGFVGFVLVDTFSGRSYKSEAGLLSFMGFLSIGIALLLLGCALMAGTRQRWVRPTTIGLEVVGVIGGAVNLFSGQFTAIAGIGLAISVISMMSRDDIREWFNA